MLNMKRVKISLILDEEEEEEEEVKKSKEPFLQSRARQLSEVQT
jgi:hypothetical protein